jgi:hypothetical protein
MENLENKMNNSHRKMSPYRRHSWMKADLEQVAADAEDLDENQQKKLLSLLKDFEDLFDGTLGKWDTDPIDIETKPNHKPSSARYYLVPKINKATFKKELLRLIEIGVLTPVQ